MGTRMSVNLNGGVRGGIRQAADDEDVAARLHRLGYVPTANRLLNPEPWIPAEELTDNNTAEVKTPALISGGSIFLRADLFGVFMFVPSIMSPGFDRGRYPAEPPREGVACRWVLSGGP